MEKTTYPREIIDAGIAAKTAAILVAVEALPDPQTYQEAERAAKALIALSRLVDKIYPTNENGEPVPVGEVTARMVAAKMAPNRHERRRQMALAKVSGPNVSAPRASG